VHRNLSFDAGFIFSYQYVLIKIFQLDEIYLIKVKLTIAKEMFILSS
jgi:hypothetical protein